MANGDVEQLRDQFVCKIEAAGDLAALEELRIEALGKKGVISQRMAELGKLPPEERKAVGQANNELKAAVTAALDAQDEADALRAEVERLRRAVDQRDAVIRSIAA